MRSKKLWRVPAVLALCGLALASGAQPPRSPRAAAQADLTGQWVAQITEDWRWRMITPPKGDYASVPLNALGRQVADRWDIAADVAAGEQCRPFGAGGLMRLPTRVRIAWADDATLKLETDAGQQTRLFHFDAKAPANEPPSWQGRSVAEWTGAPPPNPFGPVLVAPTQEASSARRAAAGAAPAGGAAARPAAPVPHGGLKVVTTNLRPGYLRKNGVPYSDQAVVTEYYDRLTLFGNDYLQVVTVVTDPVYLTTPFVVSNQFKRERDGSKWSPAPCATDPPIGKFQPPVIVQ
ncbi:MAG TPA: hypothetical protein VHH11_04065 [Gammaproteobacteria bacterium]|jgi:hypothetical protein|nr:hypothetical protein [Gammaproteobacteria bacterium]